MTLLLIWKYYSEGRITCSLFKLVSLLSEQWFRVRWTHQLIIEDKKYKESKNKTKKQKQNKKTPLETMKEKTQQNQTPTKTLFGGCILFSFHCQFWSEGNWLFRCFSLCWRVEECFKPKHPQWHTTLSMKVVLVCSNRFDFWLISIQLACVYKRCNPQRRGSLGRPASPRCLLFLMCVKRNCCYLCQVWCITWPPIGLENRVDLSS